MKDYKNMRIGEGTYQILKDKKKEWETWDGFMRRMVGELDE